MKVSIIVPIYKVERYIEQCAESVLGQTWPDIQFIFVDDGSPDASVQKLEALIDSKFTALKDRITIIRKENGGLPQARLSGLKKAEGDYILHVDSDDWLEPDAVEKLVCKAEESDADVVYFYVRKEKSGGRFHISKDKAYTNPKAFSKDVFYMKAHGYVVNKFARRSCYRPDLFYPKGNMHEDVILMGQLLFYCKKVVLLPEPLYHYRRNNSASETRQARKVRRAASARNFLDLYESYKGRMAGSPVEPVVKHILRRCWWIGIRWDRPTLARLRQIR